MEEKVLIDLTDDDYLPYYHDLANAIVRTAAEDYRSVVQSLHMRRLSETSRAQLLKERKNLLKFFHSPWYAILTDVDADYIIEKIDDEFEKKGVVRWKE